MRFLAVIVRFLPVIAVLGLPMSSNAATVGDHGLHTQPWFHESFFVLKEDIEEAASENKRVAVIFEQRGCPYCRELHRVNLEKKEIVDYIKENFYVIQIDMWGPRKVTDLDGEVMGERELAQRWRVSFTPTIVFLPTLDEIAKGKTEVARMPGYFKPFHFVSMFEYVKTGAYATDHFQRWLQAKFKKLEEEGKKPELW